MYKPISVSKTKVENEVNYENFKSVFDYLLPKREVMGHTEWSVVVCSQLEGFGRAAQGQST